MSLMKGKSNSYFVILVEHMKIYEGVKQQRGTLLVIAVGDAVVKIEPQISAEDSSVQIWDANRRMIPRITAAQLRLGSLGLTVHPVTMRENLENQGLTITCVRTWDNHIGLGFLPMVTGLNIST